MSKWDAAAALRPRVWLAAEFVPASRDLTSFHLNAAVRRATDGTQASMQDAGAASEGDANRADGG